MNENWPWPDHGAPGVITRMKSSSVGVQCPLCGRSDTPFEYWNDKDSDKRLCIHG